MSNKKFRSNIQLLSGKSFRISYIEFKSKYYFLALFTVFAGKRNNSNNYIFLENRKPHINIAFNICWHVWVFNHHSSSRHIWRRQTRTFINIEFNFGSRIRYSCPISDIWYSCLEVVLAVLNSRKLSNIFFVFLLHDTCEIWFYFKLQKHKMLRKQRSILHKSRFRKYMKNRK